MTNLITKDTFKQKIVEGFIIGVMVSLTVALSAIVWNAFDNATTRLTVAEDLLNGQSAKLQTQSDFNGQLLNNLSTPQGASEEQLRQLAADLKETRTGFEEKLTELAAAINRLPKHADTASSPTLPKSFGTLKRPIHFDPKKQQRPDFNRIGRDFRDIVKQEPLDR